MNFRHTVAWWMALVAALVIASASQAQCDRWYPLTAGGQTGTSGQVQALVVWNNQLIVGGLFATAGGQTVNNIARWDGTAFHPLTSGGQIGLDERVHDMTVWNGHLIVGGDFTTAGGQTVNKIARWDGTSWHPFIVGGNVGMSGTVNSGSVRALIVWNNSLIAGGYFNIAGGTTVNGVARWTETVWEGFTSGGQTGVSHPTPGVVDLAIWNNELVAGGGFTGAGGQTMNYIARWNGSAWLPLPHNGSNGLGFHTRAVTSWNGSIIAGGDFQTTASSMQTLRIASWNQSGWQPLMYNGQNGVSTFVTALAAWNGQLIVAGAFNHAGGVQVNNLARWTGSAWQTFSFGGQIGVNGTPAALVEWNGDLYVGGPFTTAGGMTVNRIARWDGCAPLCPADTNTDGQVNVTDLLAVIGAWGACTGCPADINDDNQVNVTDLLAVIGAWGPCL